MSDKTTHGHSHILYPPGIAGAQYTSNDHHHQSNYVVAGPGPFDGEPGNSSHLHYVVNDQIELFFIHNHFAEEGNVFTFYSTPGNNDPFL